MKGLFLITADQIIVHAIGDYILQSDWMANEKTKQHWAAFCHALVYSLPFVAFRPSLIAWLVIFVTHFFIDRYRLARYVVWAKNWISPRFYWWKLTDLRSGEITWESSIARSDMAKVGFACERFRQATPPFAYCSATGYPSNRPAWLAVWLLIFADNIMHICINGAALRFL